MVTNKNKRFKNQGFLNDMKGSEYLGVSENGGTPKSSILIGFSIIFTIHFGVPPFLETPIYIDPTKKTSYCFTIVHYDENFRLSDLP